MMAHVEVVNRPPDERHARRTALAGTGHVRGHVVGALALALALAFLWLIWLLARPLALLLAAIILANALEPVADYLTRWIRRTFAIAAIYLALFAVIIIAGALIVPSITEQVNALTKDLPTLIERGQQLAAQLGPMVGGVGSSAIQSLLSGWGGSVASLPFTAASSTIEFVLVVFLSLYWLVAMPTLRSLALSLLPADRTEQTRTVLREVGETMGGYVRGVLIEATLIGVIVYIGMSLIGVRYAAVLAVVAGLGEFVPYVGPIVAAIPAVALALLESPTQALVVIGFYLILQIVEGYILFPLVVGSQSEIPPLLIIVGLLAGGTLGGILGALIAVPLAGALRVVVLRVIIPAIRRRTTAAAVRH